MDSGNSTLIDSRCSEESDMMRNEEYGYARNDVGVVQKGNQKPCLCVSRIEVGFVMNVGRNTLTTGQKSSRCEP